MITYNDARKGKTYIIQQGLSYFDVITIYNWQNAIYHIKQHFRQRNDNVNL